MNKTERRILGIYAIFGREDSTRLAEGLRRILDRLPEDGRALAVGHSPTNEAAVLGLTGQLVGPSPRERAC